MQAAERLITIWLHIKSIINFWERQPKSKRPDSKSYNVVIKAVNDQLTVAKLSLFIYVAGILKPYLKKCQTDMPMIPYMHDDLQKIIKAILELISKTGVIAKCQTLSKIDISDRNNFKKQSKIHLGFQTEKELKSLLQKDLITLDKVSQFKKDTWLSITKLLRKLLEKTTLNSSIYVTQLC